MNHVQPGVLPDDALLNTYRLAGAFTDCYVVEVPARVLQADYVAAFYSSAVFKVERALLGLLVRRPASDADARALARGEANRFSAWHVEGREPDQLLMCDFTGRTRSWLMSAPHQVGGRDATRLYFGSAVLPQKGQGTGQPSFGLGFHALSGFHRVYSRALLGAAGSRLGT